LSSFLWYDFLVNFFFIFSPPKFARTTNMTIACDPETEEGSHRCCPSTKPSGWVTTLSKTHDMPNKSRVAREQPDKLFAILAEHTEFAELMCIYTNIHKSSPAFDHAKACSTARVSGQPWNQLDAMVKTRWWSLFTFLDSLVIAVIDEVKKSDASTDVNDSI